MDQERDALDEIVTSNERIIFNELATLHANGMNGIITTNEFRKFERFQLTKLGKLERERLALISRINETNMLIATNRSVSIRPPNNTFGRDFDFNRDGNTNQVVDASETAHEGLRNVHFSQNNHNNEDAGTRLNDDPSIQRHLNSLNDGFRLSE